MHLSMGSNGHYAIRSRRGLALLLTALLLLGCATGLHSSIRYSYFGKPDPNDAWSRKIRAWQVRERGEAALGPAQVAGGAGEASDGQLLRAKYDAYRNDRKRELARDLARWIQSQAPGHYVADGPVDHWATLEETLRANGDDCDGLELLAYYFLRDLGFGEDEVFRSIVYRPSDGQHHMVTLWFEDPEDPWVIDPTGAMTLGMPRMSEVPEWTPLKIFSEKRDFTVRRERVIAAN